LFRQGHFDESQAVLERGLPHAQRARVEPLEADIRRRMGTALLEQADLRRARTELEQALTIYRRVSMPIGEANLLGDLGWLEQAAPLAFTLQNTVDGYKLLFADGIFGEMAVFEPQELAAIPYTAARVIWQRPGSDLILPLANNLPGADTAVRTTAWLVDEALTNLYIGLARWQRGERLSAARFIQGHAVDRVLELAARLEPPQSGQADPFAPERRFEQRQPQTAVHLPAFMPGYEHSPQAARAILAFLEQHFALNEALRTAVYNADPLEGQT